MIQVFNCIYAKFCFISSNFKTKSTLINPATITTTTTSSATPKTVDPTTYYPIIEDDTKPRATFFPDTSGEEIILSTEPENKDDKEPRTLKGVKDKVSILDGKL